MFDWIVERFPEAWRELAELLVAPIAWVPRLQQVLFDFFGGGGSGWSMAGRYVFLFLPALLCLAAIWCTQLSIYTVPFRSGRVRFVSAMIVAWWDVARAVWFYWIGVVRLAGVVIGWFILLMQLAVKLVVEIVRQAVLAPMAMTGRMTNSYFQPGVPWIAFLMLLLWCALEAAIFTYTLFPTVTDVLIGLVGGEEVARFTGPILYLFLLLLIMGSFACIQALVDAIKRKEYKFIVQIVLIEVFVMFFEVMFLYRELVDAITPWVVQQTGVRLGIGLTLALASFGWVGIRGMTWFLFAQYGTPPLLAFISRQPMVQTGIAQAPSPPIESTRSWWRQAEEDFKREIDWLHERSDQLVEYLALPVLTLLAAALNIIMILLTSRPIFSLPFKGLKDVTETRELLATMSLPSRRQVTP